MAVVLAIAVYGLVLFVKTLWGMQERRFSATFDASELIPVGSCIANPSNPQDEASIGLQKVYKSFRTIRKLPDCAVLVEQKEELLLSQLKRG
ncbi:hypothetical protein V6N12_023183 [Hibiscus sabdariffa]|uniref:Uncharacterized protein n=1 Tax=Hibiscus sabdariffa TaxID=183260 RepID=A0ABR2FWX7_9ROSI